MDVAALQWLTNNWKKVVGTPVQDRMDAAERRRFLPRLRQNSKRLELSLCLQIGSWQKNSQEKTRLELVRLNKAIRAIENQLSLWDVHES